MKPALVVTDACATPDEAAHRAALESLGASFAVLVDTQVALDRFAPARASSGA